LDPLKREIRETKRYWDDCRRQCKRPCTQLQYTWIETESRMSQPTGPCLYDARLANRSEGSTCSRTTVFDVVPKQTHVKIIEEQLGYDLNQLISELGGTWGLLLGVSFITLLELVEKGVRRLLPPNSPKP
jgi:hypothetical protein